jgi:hypothetical protein
MITAQQFKDVCDLAQKESALSSCGRHVNCKVQVIDGVPQVSHVYTSDWYDSDCTLATYINGDRTS